MNDILVENQEIVTSWMPANRQHYIDKGYHYTKCRDKLRVKAEDLPHGSHMKVKVVCDYCKNVIEKEYCRYLTEHEENKDCCSKCQPKKLKELFQDRFGVSNSFQLQDTKDKSKKTCLERYGVENPGKCQEIKDKIATTNLKKYGNVCTLQANEIKAKAEQTCMDRYGVKNVFELKEIQDRIKETNREKYGDGNIAHVPEIAEKIKRTNLERYGVEYSCQSPKIIAKMRESLYKNGNVPTSKPEKDMCELLHNIFGENNCKDNFAFQRLNMDCLVNVDGVLIDFEYDGAYWHKDRENYDRRRNYFLLDNGYRIVRITGNKHDDMPTIEQIKNAVDYLVKDNHHLTYIDMNI